MSSDEAGMASSQEERLAWFFRCDANLEKMLEHIDNGLDIGIATVLGELFYVFLSVADGTRIVDLGYRESRTEADACLATDRYHEASTHSAKRVDDQPVLLAPFGPPCREMMSGAAFLLSPLSDKPHLTIGYFMSY